MIKIKCICAPSDVLPGYFISNCIKARDPRYGYASASWHLAIHLKELLDDDAARDQLNNYLYEDDIESIWGWFKAYLPRCAALVPTRRRGSFVNGVFKAWEHGRLE